MYLKVLFAFIATFITWIFTAFGSATVLFTSSNKDNKSINKMLGFSSGVMVAASIWSMIIPSLERSENKFIAVIFTTTGILSGMLLMIISDMVLSKMKLTKNIFFDNKIVMLVTSITIHNIPEGLAVGVAFGSAYGNEISSFVPAIIVATGIAIQNFPEGAAVSLPLYNSGLSKKSSFFIGQLSALVEPVFGVIGAFLVVYVNGILPFLLSFAAGCMIFVVVNELIPDAAGENRLISTVFFVLGFIIMMMLDVLL